MKEKEKDSVAQINELTHAKYLSKWRVEELEAASKRDSAENQKLTELNKQLSEGCKKMLGVYSKQKEEANKMFQRQSKKIERLNEKVVSMMRKAESAEKMLADTLVIKLRYERII